MSKRRIFLLTAVTLNFISIYSLDNKASPCGSDSIPYSLTIELDATPTLSCQTPDCFGYAHYHQDIESNYQDYEETNNLTRRMKRHVDRIAECDSNYYETVCTGNNEWTSGVKEIANDTHISLHTLCCRYDGLNDAMPLKSVILDSGDRFIGGMVKENGRMVAFDLIKEIRKNVTKDDYDNDKVQYIIDVYRMQCLPEPMEIRNKVDPYVEKQVEYLADRVTRESSVRRSEDLRTTPDYEYEETYPQKHPHIRKAYGKTNYELGYRSRDLPAYFGRNLRRRQPRPVYARRRYYRPIVEEYDDEYEDLEPVPMVRRPKYYYYRKPKSKVYDDSHLWPVAYIAKPKKARVYAEENTHYVEPISVEAMEFTPPEPQTLAPAPPIQLQQQQRQQVQQVLIDQQQQTLNQLSANQIQNANQIQPYVAPQTQPAPPPLPPLPPPASNTYQTNTGCINTGGTPARANGVETYDGGAGGGGCAGGTGNICDLCGGGSYADPYGGGAYGPGNGAGSQPQVISTGNQAANQYSGYSGQSSYGSGSYGGGGTGLNGAFGQLQCFSGDMLVQTPGGSKRIDELEIGDMVLSIEEAFITYSPVVMFLHKKSEEKAMYRQFETSSGKKVKMTDFHLIWITNCGANEKLRLSHAKDIEIGQCIFVIENEDKAEMVANQVVKINEVEEIGYYAPLTATGDIFVNNILASCHSNMAAQTLQQTFFSWWRSVHGVVNKWFGPTSMDSYLKTGDLPYGVEYLTTVMDVLVPKSFIG